MVEFQPDYFACGGNRHPSAADWDGSSGLLAFGADRNIAIWEPLNQHRDSVKALLRGHTDIVNAVRFFQCPADRPSLIVSGSSDKTVRLWQSSEVFSYHYTVAAVLEGHISSINSLAVNPERCLIVSGSADGSLKLWNLELNGNELHTSLIQTISTGFQLSPLALALSNLQEAGAVVLGVAGTKGSVQIYVADAEKSAFSLQATLVGHENWIRSLAITPENSKPGSDLILASASQDKYIRLWRIHQHRTVVINGSDTKRNFLSSLSNKAHRLKTSQTSYLLTFEALLLGHEDWIYTVQWRSNGMKLQLLSASADNSLAIWEADESSGIWLCKTRLGEISSQKGSTTATGSTGGFWIGLWSPDGQSVVSLGKTGSWRVWNHDIHLDLWTQGPGISGHTGAITGIAWARNGSFLLSTGSDQTTRLHASWVQSDASTWHEFARPQIHGYDLNCIDTIGLTQFISGADEKSLRVFDQPRATAELLHNLCGIVLSHDHAMPDAANMPVLGLSNKAFEDNVGDKSIANGDSDLAEAARFKTHGLHHPPFEDHLARHTLWPEREKLYGHGYEISAVAASHDGKVVATACKASSIDHAVIRLYETDDWHEVKPALTSHTLTVTCLRFSQDDKYLLSAGRDRQWSVFARDDNVHEKYSLILSNPKGHARMILSASWANSGRVFATAGRDKMVKLWKLFDREGTLYSQCLSTISFPAAVTAVDIARDYDWGGLTVAVGTEDGEVSILGLNTEEGSTRWSCKLDDALRPSKSVTQLAWRSSPCPQSELARPDSSYYVKKLAIASEDNSLRLFKVTTTPS